MKIYRVNDVNEAVKLAQELKEKGEYNWFRGQRENKPLISSYMRLNETQRKEEDEKFKRYYNWLLTTPGLEDLARCADDLIAVAQHYGLKTNFIDFTTNPAVAGYFASQKLEITKEPSCILCLNTYDLINFWKAIPSKYPPPELLTLKVPNLWRLEAQVGVFLFCPYDNIELFYSFDRILFPPIKSLSYPTRDDIMPKRKSPLEVLLEQYFQTEVLITGTRKARELFSHGRSRILSVNYFEKINYDIISEDIQRHSSWNTLMLKPWLEVTKESFTSAQEIDTIVLNIDIDLNPQELTRVITREMLRVLNSNKKNLRPPLSFAFHIINANALGYNENGPWPPLNKLWDGLRLLPYEDREIAVGMANIATLDVLSSKIPGNDPSVWVQIIKDYFGDILEVEFGSEDGSYSRSYSVKEDLINAFRSDISQYIRNNDVEFLETPEYLLLAIRAPELLFDFRKLANLFATQLAPIQVLIRKHAIFFSPARLSAFGLP